MKSFSRIIFQQLEISISKELYIKAEGDSNEHLVNYCNCVYTLFNHNNSTLDI